MRRRCSALAAGAPLLFLCFIGSICSTAFAESVRYKVEVVGPQPLRGAVSGNLDLLRWQDYPDMTPELLDRLMREAREQATAIAATEGYFSPTIETNLDRTKEPALLRVIITPGQPVRIDHVELVLGGPIAERPAEKESRLQPVRRDWGLPQGKVFNQQDWTLAKDTAVKTVASLDYAAARIASSVAEIDPDTHLAQLALSIDSGPAFRFGAVKTVGAGKYRPDIVQNLTDIIPGERYSDERLNQIQRRIAASGYFASVQARIDSDPLKANAAPIEISVIEAPSRRVEAGLGYSTDTLYRVLLKYSDLDIDGDSMQMHSELRLEGKDQNLSLDFTLPPRPNGTLDSFGGKIERTDFSGLTTKGTVFNVLRRNVEERNATGYELSYHLVKQTAPGFEADIAHAVYPEYQRALRNVDDLTAPTRGYVLNGRVGVGIPGLSSKGFGRVIGQTAYYFPIGGRDAIQLKAEAGAVLAGSREGVPADLLFRTGGDNTVRGYSFNSLGVKRGDVTVGGRFYALASAEYIHWLSPLYGGAVFIDAGNAGDRFSELHPVAGYGIGARVRTPIGPFRVDIAHGTQGKQLRLHLSVGITF